MSLILDLIILAIVLISVFIYAKKGFVKSVFSIAGFLAAIVLALYLSGPFANFIYTNAIEPGVVSSLEETLNVPGATLENTSNDVWEALPAIIKNNAEVLNLSPDNLFSGGNILGDTHVIAQNIADTVIKPFTVYFIKIILSLIIFVVLSIVFKFLVKILNKIFSFSLIGKINSSLGAILGLVMGIVITLIFVLIVNFIISVSGGFLIFTNDAVDSSNVFSFISNLLPVKF